MRDVTALPHETQLVGTPWNGKVGNYDTNRKPIDLIILHSMDGSLDGSTAWFKRVGGTNSAHYGVGQTGRLVNWIPENCVAYHAGKYDINQRAIGIEHEDLGDNQAVRPDALYQTAARIIAEISLAYGIPLDRDHVKKHNEIVNTSCPGTLDVDRIIREAKALITPVPAEEALHTYELKPTDFVNMVTKSSEFDEIWAVLGLDPKLKVNPGAHKFIVDDITRRVNEASAAASQNAISNVVPVVPPASEEQISPANQPNSIWKKDVLQVLKDILGSVRGGRTS